MDAHGYISLAMMACGWYEGFYNGYQNESNGFSEWTVVRRLYKELITSGDAISLTDLSKSLTTAERRVLNGNEGKIKSLKTFLSKHNRFFKLFRDFGKGKELVRPVIDIEFCKVFDSKQGCSDQHCPRLHICRHFVKGKCTFGVKCKKPHHFDDPHTVSILQRHYLDGLEHSQLKEFLCRNVQFALDDSVDESSLPKQLEICKYYNVAIGCSREGLCPFLHVCRFYAEDGTCKFGQKCIRKHDCDNEHARLILQRYNIRGSEVFSYLQNRIAPGKESSPPPNKCSPPLAYASRGRTVSLSAIEPGNRDQLIPRRVSEPSSLYQGGTNLICMKGLARQCKMKSCDKTHRPVPYCWQYSFDCRNWIEVGSKDNVKIEATFADPCKDNITVHVDEKHRIVFNFTDWVGVLKWQPLLSQEQASFMVSIRRLSTAALFASSKIDAEFATKWIWYYLDDKNKWRGFNDMAQMKNEKAPAIDSSHIESAYCIRREKIFEFKCEGEMYVIDFKTMTQQNRDTKQTTHVKRRPKLFDFNKLYKRDELEISFFPCYWKTAALQAISGGDFGQCELLELEPYSREYFKVFYGFGKSMGYENISKIAAVQNHRLWMTYTMERDKLAEKDRSNVEEITLYCAVLWQDAEQICRYGFENDTTLGKEIYYFAKDAMAANTAKKANDAGIFVTFHCRVLKNSCLSMNDFDPFVVNGMHVNTHSERHELSHQSSSQLMYHVSDGCHVYPEFIILSYPERKFSLQNDIFLYK